MFGNVNVDYKPCKSAKQLKSAADYILGRQSKQVREGIVKTADNLYWSINADRDNFARDVLLTRDLWGKKCNGNSNIAYKMSLSFHPDDNEKLTYEQAFKVAKEFAEKYFQNYEVLFAVHTDTEHIHVHFLIGNCNINTGKAYRRNQRDLYDMCEFFGKQCEDLKLSHSVRDTFYNSNSQKNHEKFNEVQMTKKGRETFKAELREVIEIELSDPRNKTIEDIVTALQQHYRVECRLKGNTISYRHPDFKDKNGQLVSVRGSKLGDKYTVKGITDELTKKRIGREESLRITAGNDKSCVHESGTRARGTGGQRSGDTAFNGAENVRDTAGLYGEYAAKVRRTEREAAESAERARRVSKKRKGFERGAPAGNFAPKKRLHFAIFPRIENFSERGDN